MGQSTAPRRVLIIDDNIDAAALVAEVLNLHGFTARVALGGTEALSSAPSFAPDVVFLDIGMPGMDGFQVAAALRSMPSLESLRIVALTAWGDAAFRARTAACGFDAHLVKPAELDILLMEATLARSSASGPSSLAS